MGQVIFLPPGSLFPFSSQLHQAFTLSWIGDSVKVAEITYIARARPSLARFKPTDLRRREQQARCDLLYGHSPIGADLAQQCAKLPPPKCRPGLRCHLCL